MSTKQKNIIIVPAWGQKADSNWYPWLKKVLETDYQNVSVRVLDTPPTVPSEHIKWLNEQIPDGPNENTVFIAHSVGNQGLIRWWASLSSLPTIGGFVGVASWWFIEEQTQSPHRPDWVGGFVVREKDKLTAWQAPIEGLDKLTKAVGDRAQVLLSDTDPFTIDQPKNKELWENLFPGGTVVIHPSRRHYNEKEEPLILEAVKKLLS